MSSTAPQGTTRPKRVYFFATCVVDLMAPQAGVDAIELIQAAGIEVDFPAAQSCCGQPAYTSGYTEEARRVALRARGARPISMLTQTYATRH